MDEGQKTIAEFDEAHERALLDAINQAIVDTSTTADGRLIIRNAETASALVTALAATIAMSDAATISEDTIDQIVGGIAADLRDKVASAAADPEWRELLREDEKNDTSKLTEN